MTAAASIATTVGAYAHTANRVESAWSKLKDLLDAATKACGLSKNNQCKLQTWWSNKQLDDAIQEKRAQFKAYSALKKGGKEACHLAGKVWGR